MPTWRSGSNGLPFDAWRDPYPVDLQAIVGAELWTQHWQNWRRVLDAMRESQALAQEIRNTVLDRHAPSAARRTRAPSARPAPAVRPSGPPRSEPADSPETMRLLRSLGMGVFVRYFDIFADASRSTGEVADMLPSDLTLAARRSRTSVARRIFREGREREALELIASAERVDADIQRAAQALLRRMER